MSFTLESFINTPPTGSGINNLNLWISTSYVSGSDDRWFIKGVTIPIDYTNKDIEIILKQSQNINFFLPNPSAPPTPSITPSITRTPSVTPSLTRTPTPSITRTPSISISRTPTPTLTPTRTPGASINPTPTVTPTRTPTRTPAASSIPGSPTPTPSITGTPAETPPPSFEPGASPSITPTVTRTPSVTPTRTVTPTPSGVCTQVILGYNSSDGQTACGKSTTIAVYINANTLFTATAIYNLLDFTCTTPNAATGWYSDGDVVRFWNNTTKTLGSVVVCPSPESPTPTPSVTTTPAGSNTPTPTTTPTSTVTPTPTPTPTVTPSSSTLVLYTFPVNDPGNTPAEACSNSSFGNITLYGTDPVFQNNTQFFNIDNTPFDGNNLYYSNIGTYSVFIDDFGFATSFAFCS